MTIHIRPHVVDHVMFSQASAHLGMVQIAIVGLWVQGASGNIHVINANHVPLEHTLIRGIKWIVVCLALLENIQVLEHLYALLALLVKNQNLDQICALLATSVKTLIHVWSLNVLQHLKLFVLARWDIIVWMAG
jgi:hypothetical protein